MIEVNTIGEKFELIFGDNRIIIDSFGAKILAFYQNDENRLFYNSEDISHSGIPLCFPNFGLLANKELCVEDKRSPMNQHGLIRDMDFSLLSQTHNTLMLGLDSNEESLKHYPFEFSFKVSFSLDVNKLEINFQWHNKSKAKSPLSPGVHPYFKIYDRENIVLQTNALSYNLSEDFSEIENIVDSSVLDAATKSSFIIKGAPNINLINHDLENTKVLLGKENMVNLIYDSNDFDRLTVWRKNADVDYICVEPANAQNKINDEPIIIGSDEIWTSKVSIVF